MKILPACTALLLFAGTAVAAPTGSVEISNPWARATPGGAETGAVYATIESPVGDRLTGASTPVARKAELHEMKLDGSIMRMRQIPAVDLPAGQKVTLQPGKVHIMLLGLKKPLHAGDKFPLTLDFAKAGQREITVPVEKVGAMKPNGQGGGMAMPARH